MKGEKTLAELAQQFDVHAKQITAWRSQLLEGAAGVFGSDGGSAAAELAMGVKTLHAKIGELTLVNDFLGRSAQESRTVAGRKMMIDRKKGGSAKLHSGIRSFLPDCSDYRIASGGRYNTPRSLV